MTCEAEPEQNSNRLDCHRPPARQLPLTLVDATELPYAGFFSRIFSIANQVNPVIPSLHFRTIWDRDGRFRGDMTNALRLVLCVSLGYVSAGGHAFADTINLGFVSFDAFIPGSSSSPGVNEFSINNFTGDPGLGGSALPSDFPIFTFLTIQGARLTLVEPSGQ